MVGYDAGWRHTAIHHLRCANGARWEWHQDDNAKEDSLIAPSKIIRIAAAVAILMVAAVARADSLPVSFTDNLGTGGGPVGYWSYQVVQPGQGLSGVALEFSGAGSMNLMAPSASGWQSVNLTWSSEEFTLGTGFSPALVSWTSETSGTFTITTNGEPMVFADDSVATSFDSTGTSSGPISECISVTPGQTISFMAVPGVTPNSEFFAEFSSTPEPSRPIAIASLLCAGGVLIFGKRGKRRVKRSKD